MSKKRLWVKKTDEEIDAVLPFMSLLLVIIPVLLSNLSFYQFRVIAISTPGAPKESSEPQELKEDLKKEKMVTAYLELYEKSAKISFLDEETAEPISLDEQSLDKKGAQVLFDLLKKIKKIIQNLKISCLK